MDENRDFLAIELIKTRLELLKHTKSSTLYLRTKEPIRAMLVYCIQRFEDKWLPLNREYKPIGLCNYSDWVTYEKYDMLMIPKDRIDEKKLSDLYESHHENYFYLFNDTTYPCNKKLKDQYISIVREIFEVPELDLC